MFIDMMHCTLASLFECWVECVNDDVMDLLISCVYIYGALYFDIFVQFFFSWVGGVTLKLV